MKTKFFEDQMLLSVEGLEERIAPGVIIEGGEEPPKPEPTEHCNNGWGNGEDCAPGNSLEHQPKFEDPNTGPTPSNSPDSGGGDR